MHLRGTFINKYGRLRSGWRFILFAICFLLVGAFVSVSVNAILSFLTGGTRAETPLVFAVVSLASLTVALVLGWSFGRVLEGLPFKALGASFEGRWLLHLGVGLAVGAAALLIAVGVAVLAGAFSFSVTGFNASAVTVSLLITAAVFAVAAAFEEVLFRGYIFQTFTRAGLAWVALIITSGIFGTVHLMNPNANAISTLNTMLAGVWLGAAYLKTRDLWFPFGVHFAWNWMQGSVFGIEVSGMTDIIPTPLLKEIDRGPDWLTGGDYGIEAGIACTIALVITTIIIYFMPGLRANEKLLALSGTESESSRANA